MVTNMNYTLLHLLRGISALAILLYANMCYAESFSVHANDTNVQLGESFSLTFSFSGNAGNNKAPDFSVLETNFDILSISPPTSIRIVNGQRNDQLQWRLELEPLMEGTFLVPPLSFGGATSQAIEITAHTPSKSQQQQIMLETIIDKPSIYVQEQLRVSYRLYHSVRIGNLRREPLELPDAQVLELQQYEYQRSVSGKKYNVIEFNYLVLPQKRGVLSIPSLRWSYQYSTDARGWYSKTQSKRSQAKAVRVKGIPTEFPTGATWLPAREITLSDSWSSSIDNVSIGEPLTRTITMQASGLGSTQLPKLVADSPEQHSNYKLYSEKPELEDQANEFGLLSTRVETLAVVFSNPGASVLPTVSIPWWDTDTDSLEYATINPVTLEINGDLNNVIPSTNRSASSTSEYTTNNGPALSVEHSALTKLESSPNEHDSPTYHTWLIILLGITNIVLLGVIVRQYFSLKITNSEPKNGHPSPKKYWKSLNEAVKTNDHNATYIALTEFVISELGFASVDDFLSNLDATKDAEFSQLVKKLRNHLYSENPKSTSLTLSELLRNLKLFVKAHNASKSDQKKSKNDLVTLYASE